MKSPVVVLLFSALVLVVVYGQDEALINRRIDDFHTEVQRLPEYASSPKPENGDRQMPPQQAIGAIIGNLPGALLNPIRALVYTILMTLADFLRKLGSAICGALMASACQLGRSMEKLFGADHFIVRFMREFFEPETSPFTSSLQIWERLDSIMDIYWSQ